MRHSLFIPPKLNKEIYISDRILGILDKSVKLYYTTFIQGITGLGKTSLVVKWMAHRKLSNQYNIYWVDCNESSEKLMNILKEAINKEQDSVLVIWDHYEKVAFGPLDKYIVDINKGLPPDSRICFITKGRIPDYVTDEITVQRTNLISCKNLMFNTNEIRQYINVFKHCNLEMDSFALPADAFVMPIMLDLMVIQYEKNGRTYQELIEHVREQVFWHLKATVVDYWTQEEFEIIKRVYPFNEINEEVIRIIYGDNDNYLVLTAFADRNCFLVKDERDNLVFTKLISNLLERLFSVLLDREDYLNVNNEAIRYYESKKDYASVTALNVKIGAYEDATRSLLKLQKTSNNHKLQSQYVKYYHSIPEEIIKSSAEAIFWKIINCLVQFDMTGFTKWYEAFMHKYTTSELTEAQWVHMDLTYVYIMLISPTTTVDEFIHIVRKSDKNFTMNQFIKKLFIYEEMDMVTFLLLRRWNFDDGVERFLENPILEHYLGEQLYALIMLYLGIRYCQSFRMEEAVKCLEIGVCGCRKYKMYGPGLYGELFLLDTQRSYDIEKYDILGKKEEIIKVHITKADYLYKFDSFYIKIWLQRRNIEKINTWISEQRKDLYDTHNLVSFRYFLQHIRVQILVEDLYDAQQKLDALIKSCEEFGFEADRVECYILYSIIYYRKNMQEQAIRFFLKAYLLAKKHGLNQIIIYEGVAIQPIVFSVAKKLPNIGYENEFQEILLKVNARAKHYPKYLIPSAKQNDILTKTEIEMLLELYTGDTLIQIAKRRCISLNTVKQHTKSIYTKLKVNKRSMAISIAKERGLI